MSGEPSPGIFVMATRLKARALVITQQKTLNALRSRVPERLSP
jgi:hypothetical protein